MKTTTTTTKTEIVAEICLYGGGADTGTGYIARARDGRMFGTGTPDRWSNQTAAVWRAVEDLNAGGVYRGTVAIFAPGGERRALAPLEDLHALYFGDLAFETTPIVQASAV